MVPARLSSFVNLSFSPLEPGNFYKRVYLLLRNQAPQVMGLPSLATPFAAPPFPARRYTPSHHASVPLQVVHLSGSGYTEKRRPMPITPAFVSDYQIRELRGGTPRDASRTQRAATARPITSRPAPLPLLQANG